MWRSFQLNSRINKLKVILADINPPLFIFPFHLGSHLNSCQNSMPCFVKYVSQNVRNSSEKYIFLNQLFGCSKVNFGLLTRRQPLSSNLNYSVSSYFNQRSTRPSQRDYIPKSSRTHHGIANRKPSNSELMVYSTGDLKKL